MALGVQRALHLQRLHAHVHAEVHLRREGPAIEHEVGRDEIQPLGRHIGLAMAVCNVGDDLQSDPQTGQSGHHVAVQPEVENLLHIGRIQRRHAHVPQHRFALARQAAALAAGVVAEDGQYAAVLVNAGVVRVLQCVAAAVDPRRLAVPHAGDTVELLARHGMQHLRAPHGGGREVFIETVDEMNVVLEQQLLLSKQ
jgi:hypothetical protein